MFEETELIRKSKEYATSLLKSLPKGYHYHNLDHTRDVVKAARELCERAELPAKETELVTVAAWFHDVGYTQGKERHEMNGSKIMADKLAEWGVSTEDIERVKSYINATEMPQSPDCLAAQILCDSDLYHLSTKEFKNRTEDLRKELHAVHDVNFAPNDWYIRTLEFLDKHKYFTEYGTNVLEKRKQENRKWLKANCADYKDEEIKKLEDKLNKLKGKTKEKEKGGKKDKNGKKDKGDKEVKVKKPDRGIETMFRITSKNHLTLSGMADNKANIMISINSIILSVLVSVLFRKFEDYPNLIVPGMILVGVCLTTIVFAVLATRPNISSGTFTREDIEQRKTNLLFFGNFHGMELDNYMWGMKEMMNDSDFLYGSMIKDIYFLGIVLGKKYKMLRKSYNVFMFGFSTAVIAFIIALVFFPVKH
ncbi:Pycsar system effector family protein [Fulvivirga ligni]|uniref:Pycsar system effector family protein n=1 Tax=Fulvivirga ligni TaxID=2904246 RepID=UPI001F3B2BC3|nr:Pycsar system effector family protein [Fulvivirga ligni]UII22776.1 DUF5706 domain-containing protein [Fulvivirga ligni]